MRVTPDQFLRYILEHAVDVEPVEFAGDFGVHHDQQQEVAEFFPKICVIVGARRPAPHQPRHPHTPRPTPPRPQRRPAGPAPPPAAAKARPPPPTSPTPTTA